MSTADTYVRARIDTATKERAADALKAMGLTVSDAIRLLMLRIADERRLPFEVKVPNAACPRNDLTDQMPRKVWIAIGAQDWQPSIDYPPLRIVRFCHLLLTNA